MFAVIIIFVFMLDVNRYVMNSTTDSVKTKKNEDNTEIRSWKWEIMCMTQGWEVNLLFFKFSTWTY